MTLSLILKLLFSFETESNRGLEYNFDHRKGDVFVRFMSGARSNIAYNCLERNIQKGIDFLFFCAYLYF